MMGTKDSSLKELKEKTKHFSKRKSVCFALLNTTKELFRLLWFLIGYLVFGVFEIGRLVLRIALALILIATILSLGYSFVQQIIGNEPVIDLARYNVVIIVSATLTLLVIEFTRLVENHKKVTEEKKKYLKQSAEMLFRATVYLSVIYILSLLHTITTDFPFRSFNISKILQDQIVDMTILVAGLVAALNLFLALYQLMTKIGTIYEFPENEEEMGFFKRIKTNVKKSKIFN